MKAYLSSMELSSMDDVPVKILDSVFMSSGRITALFDSSDVNDTKQPPAEVSKAIVIGDDATSMEVHNFFQLKNDMSYFQVAALSDSGAMQMDILRRSFTMARAEIVTDTKDSSTPAMDVYRRLGCCFKFCDDISFIIKLSCIN
jgi:hypothetical protein